MTEVLKKYEFLNEIWDYIKEFAGVYDIKTNWKRRLIGPLYKLQNLFYTFKNKKEWKFGDMTWERGELYDRKAIMWDCFWKEHKKKSFSKNVFNEISKYLVSKKRSIKN